MTETKAPDYITSIRNELEDLEAKLERVELIASRAEREIPDLERRRRYLVTDALIDGGEAAGELANVESMIAAARLEHERASIAVEVLEEHIEGLRWLLRGRRCRADSRAE